MDPELRRQLKDNHFLDYRYEDTKSTDDID
jgi:hypothetical protein